MIAIFRIALTILFIYFVYQQHGTVLAIALSLLGINIELLSHLIITNRKDLRAILEYKRGSSKV